MGRDPWSPGEATQQFISCQNEDPSHSSGLSSRCLPGGQELQRRGGRGSVFENWVRSRTFARLQLESKQGIKKTNGNSKPQNNQQRKEERKLREKKRRLSQKKRGKGKNEKKSGKVKDDTRSERC